MSDSKIVRFELEHEDGSLIVLEGDEAQKLVDRINNAVVHWALRGGKDFRDVPWQTYKSRLEYERTRLVRVLSKKK